jgi:hypothetical protein
VASLTCCMDRVDPPKVDTNSTDVMESDVWRYGMNVNVSIKRWKALVTSEYSTY